MPIRHFCLTAPTALQVKKAGPFSAGEDMSRDIVSGIAITCLIFAASVYIPIIGFFCALLIPLPVLFYRAKLGRTNGMIVPVGTLVAMVVFSGRVSVDTMVFTELMLLGFLLGEGFEWNLPVELTVLFVSGTVLLTAAGGLLFYGVISDTGVAALISGYVAKNLELTLGLYRDMGVSEESIRMFSDSMEHIRYVLIRVIPSFAVISALFVSWTSLLMIRPILESRSLFYPAFGRLNLWKAPDHLVWGVIGCGLILLVSDKGMKMIGLNGLLIFMTVYFFQGIAVVSFFFQKKNFPRMLRVFLYSLIALQQMALFLVIGCGFFDIWLNFRKLNTEKQN